MTTFFNVGTASYKALSPLARVMNDAAQASADKRTINQLLAAERREHRRQVELAKKMNRRAPGYANRHSAEAERARRRKTTSRYSFTLTAEEGQAAIAAARSRGTTISRLGREALEHYIKAQVVPEDRPRAGRRALMRQVCIKPEMMDKLDAMAGSISRSDMLRRCLLAYIAKNCN